MRMYKKITLIDYNLPIRAPFYEAQYISTLMPREQFSKYLLLPCLEHTMSVYMPEFHVSRPLNKSATFISPLPPALSS